jgi:ribosomal protein S17E
MKNFEQYLKHLELVQKNEPEKYEFIKEIADGFTDIELSRFLENIALSFEKNKKAYLEITSKATKEIFLKEQIELYICANHRFERFGDYANEMFDKYKPIFTEALEYWERDFNILKTLPPRPINSETKPVKYKADEYALAYVFDLCAKGKQVPTNRIEGGYNAKKIKEDSALFYTYDKTPDGFYRAVKKVLGYDLNKRTDLQNISSDWYNAVKVLSNNWLLTEQYLTDKGLIKE